MPLKSSICIKQNILQKKGMSIKYLFFFAINKKNDFLCALLFCQFDKIMKCEIFTFKRRPINSKIKIKKQQIVKIAISYSTKPDLFSWCWRSSITKYQRDFFLWNLSSSIIDKTVINSWKFKVYFGGPLFLLKFILNFFSNIPESNLGTITHHFCLMYKNNFLMNFPLFFRRLKRRI